MDDSAFTYCKSTDAQHWKLDDYPGKKSIWLQSLTSIENNPGFTKKQQATATDLQHYNAYEGLMHPSHNSDSGKRTKRRRKAKQTTGLGTTWTWNLNNRDVVSIPSVSMNVSMIDRAGDVAKYFDPLPQVEEAITFESLEELDIAADKLQNDWSTLSFVYNVFFVRYREDRRLLEDDSGEHTYDVLWGSIFFRLRLSSAWPCAEDPSVAVKTCKIRLDGVVYERDHVSAQWGFLEVSKKECSVYDRKFLVDWKRLLTLKEFMTW
ncbi:hypothetical protein BZA77DRAFT_297312 [Pyronema omphalodes]|nr:hypothetical protein BZA77DRAFT_297312 [Pyronema omphalodes]